MSEKQLEENFKVPKELDDESKETFDPEIANNMENGESKVSALAELDEENTELPENEIVELKNSEKIVKVAAKVFAREFSGPIPSPDIMADYENIMPGATDRIILMAENQSKHRQSMEAIKVNAESRDSFLGVIFAFMLGLGCIVACVIMVIMVPSAAGVICGSVLGVTGITAIISTFLQNTRNHAKEENKE